MVGHSRDHHGVAQQVGTADLLDAAHLLALNRPKLGKVHAGPGDQAQAGAVAGTRSPRLDLRRDGRGLHRASHDRASEALHIGLSDAAFGAAALHLSQRHA